MEPRLVERVDSLLDAMAARGANAEVDLIAAFASAIPVEIIGNLLDVPGDERAPLRDWSLAILGALEPALTAEQLELGNRAVTEMLGYLEGLVERRRAAPGDPEVDVLTRLIEGEGEGDGKEALGAAELLHNCIFLLNAGHETTTNLIGNGLAALLDWPGEKARLIERPELVRLAVEEFLRFESSNQLGNRITTCATEIGGVALAPRTQVTLGIGSANRDEAAFADPDRLDVSRQPNRHVAFGSGIHQCVGMGLARLEGRVAIGRFLARFPHYRAERPGRARAARALSRPRAPGRRRRSRLNHNNAPGDSLMHPLRSAAALLGLALATALPLAAHAQVKIGVTLSTTGPAVSLGIPEKNTIAMLPKTVGGMTRRVHRARRRQRHERRRRQHAQAHRREQGRRDHRLDDDAQHARDDRRRSPRARRR